MGSLLPFVPILRGHDPARVIGKAQQEGGRMVLEIIPDARITRVMIPADAFRVLEERDGYLFRVEVPYLSVAEGDGE